MMRLLLKKALSESILLLVACGIMLFIFCWMRVWIVCQFDLEQFKPMLDQFRMFEKYSPVPLEQLLTYAGSIGMTFSEPVLILCVMVWSISRGSDVISGELSRGTMEMLLSQPIGRTRLLLTHAAVCVSGLVLLCAVAWLGLYVGIQTNSIPQTVTPTATFRIPFLPLNIPVNLGESERIDIPLSDRVAPSLYTLPTINLFAFGFFVLALTTMLSSLDRYRWRTIGVVIGIYVVQLLIFLLSRAADWANVLGYLSFFACYQPDATVSFVQRQPQATWLLMTPSAAISPLWPHSLTPLGLSLVLIVLGFGFYLVALVRFRWRDLPAPL